MSTQVATPEAQVPLPPNAYCPTCGQVLPPRQIDEFPKAMYKKIPKAKAAKPEEEEDQVDIITVLDGEEQKKKEGEGYSPDIPAPKGAAPKPKEAPKAKEPEEHTDEPRKSEPHHNKKS